MNIEETKMTEKANCTICGHPMPPGEEMFKFHGYSGPCPKPALIAPKPLTAIERIFADEKLARARKHLSFEEIRRIVDHVKAADAAKAIPAPTEEHSDA